MIVTLTINPAIDRTFTVERLVFEDRARVMSAHESAGGRGINAACVVSTFGGETVAVLTSGGKSGRRLAKYLRCFDFPCVIVPIRNEIRTNVAITDRQGLTVSLNEAGPPLDSGELQRLEKVVERKLKRAHWLMICGSVPPGVPDSFYAKLIALARARDVRTLLDTDGPALLEGIAARPTVVTPNQQEAERLLGRMLLTRNHFLEAAREIRTMGAESVVLSLGSRGAIGAFSDGMYEATPPPIEAVCPIGAGDALAAAYAWALERDGDPVDALRWGVAAGTASARLPGLRLATLPQAREIYPQVETRRVE